MKVKITTPFHIFETNSTYDKNTEVEFEDRIAKHYIEVGYAVEVVEETVEQPVKKERKAKTKVE